MAQRRNFLAKLFDFSFSEFVAIQIIGIIYILGLVGAGLVTLAIVAGGFNNGALSGLIALIISPVLFLLYSILVRVGLEGFVATIRTAENTRQIVEQLRQKNP